MFEDYRFSLVYDWVFILLNALVIAVNPITASWWSYLALYLFVFLLIGCIRKECLRQRKELAACGLSS